MIDDRTDRTAPETVVTPERGRDLAALAEHRDDRRGVTLDAAVWITATYLASAGGDDAAAATR